MRIGKTRLDARHPNEVRYYYPGRGPSVFQENLEEDVPWPYGGWYIEAMDSHGAWIASATDLAKFAAAFDDPNHCKVLSADSIGAMFARPPGLAGHEEDGTEKPTFYSLGWFNRAAKLPVCLRLRPAGVWPLNRYNPGAMLACECSNQVS